MKRLVFIMDALTLASLSCPCRTAKLCTNICRVSFFFWRRLHLLRVGWETLASSVTCCPFSVTKRIPLTCHRFEHARRRLRSIESPCLNYVRHVQVSIVRFLKVCSE
jgi:hypothetical protein